MKYRCVLTADSVFIYDADETDSTEWLQRVALESVPNLIEQLTEATQLPKQPAPEAQKEI